MPTLRRFWPFPLLAALVAVGALLHTSPHRARQAPSFPAPQVFARAPSSFQMPGASPIAARRSALAAARPFAFAYLRYLEGQTSVAALGPATPAVRAAAQRDGPIPVWARDGALHLRALARTRGSTPVSPQLTLSASDRKDTFYAQLTLADTRSGWMVTRLVPPDYPMTVGSSKPGPPAAPSAAAVAAAAFMGTYVPWTYGQLNVDGIKAASSPLRATLAANPPRVPLAVRRLHPRVSAPVLELGRGADAWRGWAALATVSDGVNSYQVAAQLQRIAGQWMVVKLLPTG